ncbi:protein mono-ADP-ribosyltransferase PARP4 [Clarias gariepinus]
MSIFSDCSVVLDLKHTPFKEKRKLTNALLDNGGNISYIVNQKCSFLVTNNLESLSTSRWRSAQKHQTPVVSPQYVWNCLEKGLLLPVQEHVLSPLSSDLAPEQDLHPGLKSRHQSQPQNHGIHDQKAANQVKDGTYLGQFRVYKDNDDDIPEFPSEFHVAKYSILAKAHLKIWSVLELQSAKGQAGQQYRVVSSIVHEREKSVILDKQVHSCSSEDALEAYLMLRKDLQVQGFTQTQTLPPWAEKLISDSLQQLLLEEKLNCSTVSQEVGTFVELIWTEALGSLSSILTVPVTSISLNDVSRVEGLLLQVQKSQREDEVKGLLEEVKTLLPLRIREPDSKNKLVSQKLDLCQLIRDILNMSEATLGNPSPSSLGKYRALRCSIEQVPPQSAEFLSVSQLLEDRPAQIQQILRVSRGTELHMFRKDLGNVKSLLHSTASSSLVGILSRGLLLPRVGVEQHGIERTDIGNLGSGIYFSDSLNTSMKYSKPSVTDGCRLLLVCEVALGQCQDLHKRDFTLTCAPEGYNSVHGVRRTRRTQSDFEDDEYVVYNTDQIRLKYVVQYFLNEDEIKDFQPHVDTTLAPLDSESSSHLLSSDDGEGLGETKNPLEDVTAGLLDSNGQTLPLQAVHVRCKLMDLLSQVIIFQTYTNNSSFPIEAKYVFPLEETAAVCGFEAFINGKHVIGKVKEKEQARKEYKQAIEKGHGAYLMDQDAPDVFTISVGNLPPGATVLIKVTFITELVVRAGTIVFSLPGSVAPWQQSSALNQRTQTTVEKVCVNELQPEGEFSLCMSVEMPYEIINLECSHQIKIKRTDCKAVVSTLPDQMLSTDGFWFSFSLFQIHMPRMWVEKHPEKDTEACMLVFYPQFESSDVSGSDVSDVIIMLDTSESMRGDGMLNARRIALKVLNSLDRSLRVNIISFGSDYKEAFPSASLLEEVFDEAKKFIMTLAPVGGSTELWRPLRTLNLLPPSRGIRNVLLISDGHVQNQPQTLQLVRNNVRHTRLFTCGLNPTANRYMLRALAQAGGGTYEFFDTKTKHTWAEKVNSQVRCMLAPGCSSVAVKWQQFNPTAPSPVQAPSQLHALFNDCHTLVYGFVPHCTRATLFGDLSGKEIETMVSTTELQKTKGTFLHKLTARAVIRDFEDGSLGCSEAEHEGKKAELKSYIIELSKEFSILSQFTSFVAIEERDQDQPDSGFTNVPKIIEEEDVDILPYMAWTEQKEYGVEPTGTRLQLCEEEDEEKLDSEEEVDMGYCLFDAEDSEYAEGGSLLDLCALNMEAQEESSSPGFPEFTSFAQLSARSDALPYFSECPSFSMVGSALSDTQPLHIPDVLDLSASRHASIPSTDIFSSSSNTSEVHPTLPIRARHVSSSLAQNEAMLGSARLTYNRAGVVRPARTHKSSFFSPTRASHFSGGIDQDEPMYESAGLPSLPAEACHVWRRDDLSERGGGSPAPPPSPPSGGSHVLSGVDLFGPAGGLAAPPPPPPPPGASSVLSDFALHYVPMSGLGAPSYAPVSPSAFASTGAPTRLYKKTAAFLSTGWGSKAAPTPPPSVSFRDLPHTVESEASVPPSLPIHWNTSSYDAHSFGSIGAPGTFSSLVIGAPATSSSLVFGDRATLSSHVNGAPAIFSERAASEPPLQKSCSAPPPPVASAQPCVAASGATFSYSGIKFSLPARSASPVFGASPSSSAIKFRSPVVVAAVAPPPPPSADMHHGASDLAQPCFVPKAVGRSLMRRSKKRSSHSFDHEMVNAYETRSTGPLETAESDQVETDSIREQYRRPDRINWEELLNLQHQDGYWECTGTLSRFLGLDVDFFANVFLKEKGICSLGTKAHADILKLVATLLVLQLMRVLKIAEGKLFQSLFRLTDYPEPRPACWEAVTRAVKWVCWADRQYPCVCSRLEFGSDWESCTRQLLGLDPLPPVSPLIPLLQRRAPVM